MTTCDHGVVAKVKRNIMERDLYPRRWGLGPTALEKKKLKADGKLDKFGRTNEATPSQWKDGYKDYSAAAESAAGEAPKAALPAPEAAPAPAAAAPAEADEDSKKRKKEDESPEDKAERKRRKAEKKAAKEAKKAAKGKKDDSDSD